MEKRNEMVVHIYLRGRDRGVIFYDDVERLVYFSIIASQARKMGVRVLAAAIMYTHVHICAMAASWEEINRFIQESSSEFARLMNFEKGRSGRFFGFHPGKAQKRTLKFIKSNIIYVFNNHVEKRLCAHATEERWSFLAYGRSKWPFSAKAEQRAMEQEPFSAKAEQRPIEQEPFSAKAEQRAMEQEPFSAKAEQRPIEQEPFSAKAEQRPIEQEPFSAKAESRAATTGQRSEGMRRAMALVRRRAIKSKPLKHSELRRLMSSLSEAERERLKDFIITSYALVDFDAAASFFGSFEAMITAIDSTAGSEWDIKEEFCREDDRAYQHLIAWAKKNKLCDANGTFNPYALDNATKAKLTNKLLRTTDIPLFQIRKFLHFFPDTD